MKTVIVHPILLLGLVCELIFPKSFSKTFTILWFLRVALIIATIVHYCGFF